MLLIDTVVDVNPAVMSDLGMSDVECLCPNGVFANLELHSEYAYWCNPDA